MKWGNIEIKKLTDDELRDAIHSVGSMDGFRVDQLSNYRERHKKLFEKHPPTENELFAKLVNELNVEFKNRKLTNV